MAKLKNVANVTKISWGTVGSVAVGIALFGAVMFAINRLPSNAATDVIKRGANVVNP